jgi:hypothetical protein
LFHLAKQKAEKTESAAAPSAATPAKIHAPAKPKIPKLAPKNKSRLPRKEKKAQKKAAGRL